MTTGSDSSTATDRRGVGVRAPIVGALTVGTLGVVLAAAGSWRPSVWYDEAATLSAVNRSYSQLFSLVHHVDAVHAAYYLVIKAWVSVFGTSEFSLRMPSAIAVGAAAGLLVVVGNRLWGSGFGIAAGLALLTVPRVMWAGDEARSYAGTLFLAVALTLVLLIAADRGRWWWALYAIVLVSATAWFFLAGALVAAHAVYLLVIRRSALPWLFGAVVGAGIMVSPFAWWVIGQRGQINWIPDTTWATAGTYSRWEFFDGSWPYLLVAAVVVVMGALAAVFARRGDGCRALVLAVSWLLVPAVIVGVVSWASGPLYTPRYLVFTAPALALLLAWSARSIARESRWITGVVLVVLAVAAMPAYVAGREPYGRTGGTDFSAVADYVGTHARPGDCVAFDAPPSWSPVSQRMLLRAKPEDFVGLRDIGPAADATRIGELWDRDRPMRDYQAFAQACEVMWVITDGDRATAAAERPGGATTWYFEAFDFGRSPLDRELTAAGLHVTSQVRFNHSQVVRMQRGP